MSTTTAGRHRHLGAALNPLWVRSPLLLFRYPGLLTALTAGALLLVLAAAAYPLFMAAASSAVLSRQIDSITRFGAGVSLTEQASFRARHLPLNAFQDPLSQKELRARPVLYEHRTDVFESRIATDELLGKPISTVLGPTISVARSGRTSRLRDARLLAKTGALGHVEVVAGEEGPGIWLADTVASSLGVQPGGEVVLSQGGVGPQRTVTVDGIYRALFNQPRAPYWRSLSREIYPSGDAGAPPAFAIADRSQLIDISLNLNERSGQFRWEAPLHSEGPITLTEARALAAEVRQRSRALLNVNSPLGRSFGCVGVRCFRGGVRLETLLPVAIAQTEQRIAGIEGPVQLLFAAGLIVATAVVAAAGAFAIATRRIEAALLFARGMSPATVGLKACLEFLLPAVLGGVLGLVLAVGLVTQFGPDGSVDGAAFANAIRAAVISVPLAMVLLGVVAAFAYLRQSETATKRLRLLAGLPWELAILFVSLYFLRQMLAGGALIPGPESGVARPSIYILLFPIFFVAGFGGACARLFQALLRRLRSRSGTYPSSVYLVVHRLAGAPRLTLLLFTASALALGVFVYSQTMVSSLEATVDAKSKLFVGSNVQATILADQNIPERFPLPNTKVTRIPAAGTIRPGNTRVDLLAIDPETLPDAAYFEAEFGAPSLASLVRPLERFDGGRVPVIAVGDQVSGDPTMEMLQTDVPLEVVAGVEAFPGMLSNRPLVVANARTIVDVFSGVTNPLEVSDASTQVWVEGSTGEAVAALNSLERRPYYIVTAQAVKDIPSISAVVQTFGVLKFLGASAGLLVIVLMLMYLQARQKGRIISYALSRRMGLGNVSHRFSLMFELGGLLISSFVVGVVLATISARLVIGRVDPLATIPPAPLFRPALVLVLALLIALVAVAVVGGAYTNRSAERSDFAEVMRLAA